MWVMMTADIYYNYWLQAKMHGENFEFVVFKNNSYTIFFTYFIEITQQV